MSHSGVEPSHLQEGICLLWKNIWFLHIEHLVIFQLTTSSSSNLLLVMLLPFLVAVRDICKPGRKVILKRKMKKAHFFGQLKKGRMWLAVLREAGRVTVGCKEPTSFKTCSESHSSILTSFILKSLKNKGQPKCYDCFKTKH